MIKESPIVKTTFIVLSTVLGIFVFFRYIFRLLLPFLIAFVIAFLLRSPIAVINKRTGVGKRAVSAVFVSVTVLFIGFMIFLIGSSLLNELQRFSFAFSQNSESYVSQLIDFVDSVSTKFPFSFFPKDELTGAVADALTSTLSKLTAKLPAFIAGVIATLPEILLFTVIIIMASYYFCADYEKTASAIVALIPVKVSEKLSLLKARLMSTGLSYLRSCLVLVVITYFELLVGFMILDVPYAFTLSLLIAFIDMLPVFGVGTVLIPWSIYAKLTGDTYLAIGIFLVFLTVTIVRRFIEPRIISEGIGLSPITTLLSMYIGFRIFGLTGLFFAPVVTILLLHLLPEKTARLFGFNSPKEVKN